MQIRLKRRFRTAISGAKNDVAHTAVCSTDYWLIIDELMIDNSYGVRRRIQRRQRCIVLGLVTWTRVRLKSRFCDLDLDLDLTPKDLDLDSDLNVNDLDLDLRAGDL
jgi:hypothetical protein